MLIFLRQLNLLGIRQDEFTVSNNEFSDLGDLGAGTSRYKAASYYGGTHPGGGYPGIRCAVESDDTSYKIDHSNIYEE